MLRKDIGVYVIDLGYTPNAFRLLILFEQTLTLSNKETVKLAAQVVAPPHL